MPEHRLPPAGPAGPLIAALAALCLAPATYAQELPQTAPVPAFRPDPPAEPGPTPPLPAPRAEGAGAADPPPAVEAGAPPAPGVLGPKPAAASDPRSALRPDPSGALPAAEAECRRRLGSLGVQFDNGGAQFDPEAGCSVPYPVTIRSFGRGIELEPEARMSCAMAEATARFVQDIAAPAALAVFGKGLRSVSQASAYVCRPRRGGRKLSEHAFGNALDIAAFTLADGTPVAVEPQPRTKPARFLGMLRRAACGSFATVLGPGSDADHATHLHVDLQPRRSGRSFCR